MRKFFCNYNYLTEKYELGLNRNMIFNSKINVLAQNTLLPEINKLLQNTYDNNLILKDKITDEEQLKVLDENDLLISNLYFSLFASPLDLNETKIETNSVKDLINKCIINCSQLEAKVNIPEYNRLCMLLKNNYQNLFNALS